MDLRWVSIALLLGVIILASTTTTGDYVVYTEIPEYIMEDHLNLTGSSVDTTNWERGDTAFEDFRGGNFTNVSLMSIGNGAVGLVPELEFNEMNGGDAVLEPGSSTDWDSIILDFDIVRDKGTWYMYYTGSKDVGKTYPDHIGLATSSNGISWTKYSGNPILKAQVDSFDYDYLTTPQVVRDGNVWRMYYGGATHDGVTDYIDVCYAMSTDGVNWSKSTTNPVIVHGAPTSKWDGRLAQPTGLAHAANGSLLLFYRGKGTSGVTYLGLAQSNDGVNWTKNASNPLRSASTTGWEDGWFLGYTLEQANGTNRLWTVGDVDEHKIGYCTSDDLVTWEDSGSAVLVPKAGTKFSSGVTNPKVIEMGDHYRMYLRGDDDSNVFRFFAFNVTPKRMEGTFVSKVVIPQILGLMKIHKIIWTEEVPAVGHLDMYIRWANVSDKPGKWLRVSNDTDLGNMTAKYMWYKVEMRTDVDWTRVALLDAMFIIDPIVVSVDVRVDGGPWQPVNGPFDDWYLNVSLEDGLYYIDVRTNNTYTYSHVRSIPVKVDLYPPTGGILIEDGRYAVNSTWVKIDVEANDTHTPIQMQLSRQPDFAGATWMDHIPSATYGLLGNPEGEVTIYLRLRDAAGRVSETYNDTIIIDTMPPFAHFYINGGRTTTNSTQVTLNITWEDVSGVTEMMVSNDPTFEGAGWITPVHDMPWTLEAGDDNKVVYVRLRDAVGWVTDLSDNIILDQAVPSATLTINGGDPYTTIRDVTLTITTYDDYTVVGNFTQFKLANAGEPWPKEWRASEPEMTIPWVLPEGLDGARRVRLIVMDNAPNFYEIFDEIVLDTTPPDGEMVVNGGDEFTIMTLASISINASDGTSGLDRMRISNTDDFTGVSWQSFKERFSWPLETGDGVKNVFVQIMDRAGLVATMDDSIILDSTPPSGKVTIVGVGEYTNDPKVQLYIEVTDVFGLAGMQVSNDPLFPDAPLMEFASTLPWDLGDQEGEAIVYVRVLDRPGNVLAVSDSVILDLEPPSVSLEFADQAEYTLEDFIDFTWSASDSIGLETVEWYPEESPGDRVTIPLEGVTSSSSNPARFELSQDPTEPLEVTIVIVATDLVGRTTTTLGVISFVPGIPEGVIVIDFGAEWTNDTRVDLSIAFTGGLSPTHFRVALSKQALEGTEWREAQPTLPPGPDEIIGGLYTSTTLEGPGGEKEVWCQLKGAFDIVSEPFSDTIKLDVMAPDVDIVSPTAAGTEDDSAKLSLTVTDDQDTEPVLEWRINGGEWRPYSGEERISLKEGDNLIEVRAQDAAGNVGTAEWTISSDRGFSVGGASWLILLVVLVVVGLVGFWYWRGRQRPEDGV